MTKSASYPREFLNHIRTLSQNEEHEASNTARARLVTARARLPTARARLAAVEFQHSTCKTSRGGIFMKEILYTIFRPHEKKGLSSLLFLSQNFGNFNFL